jgi:HAD superfamily hydrolase (TIGR01509 family)
MAEIEAVLWDMDGVIADSGPYHLAAWQEIFGQRGVKFTAEDFSHSFGLRNDSIIRNTLGKDIAQAEIYAIAQEKEVAFRRLVGDKIKPLPGAIELIKSLRNNGFRMAIASSAPMENIELVTGTLGIAGCFQALVTGHDVTEGKPANCLVIEDAVAGVTAAKRAGMYCLAVINTHTRQELAEADLIMDSLEKVTIEDIKRLGL